jgi:translation initiation factor 2 beta subunit (eIF-2beta)/eIF-5
MTAESETEPDGAGYLRPTERALVVCRRCGKPSPATRRADGSLRLLGSIDCLACGGADFRVLAAEDFPERW